MIEFLKMVASDQSGNTFVILMLGGIVSIVFTYWFFDGAAKLVRAFRGKS